MNKFEEQLKNSLQDYKEVEYNQAHWDKIAHELDKSKRKKVTYLSLGGVLTLGLLVGLAYDSTQNADSSYQLPFRKVDAKVTEQNGPETKSVGKVAKSNSVSMQDTEQLNNSTTESTQAIPEQNLKTVSTENNSSQLHVKKNSDAGSSFNFSINASKKALCTNEPSAFTSTVNFPATYLWSFGDGKTSNLPNPSHTYLKAGNYAISLKVTSLLDGSTSQSKEWLSVVVNQSPVAKFTFEIENGDNFDQVLKLENTTKNAIYAEWLFEKTIAKSADVSFKVNKRGNYITSLIVKNDLGCYDTLTQNIRVDKDYNLLAPTAFTPDDDGQNDSFLPKALENSTCSFTMDILDAKSGAVIFSSNSRAKPWNGQNALTGKNADKGTYVWIVTLSRPGVQKELFKGNISIVK